MRSALLAAWLGALVATGPAMAANTDEATPKRGGTLTYMIPADAPPSLDLHREATYALVHAVAPFYSVLMRVNPENPSDTTQFVCDLCTSIPKPTDDGKTYTFKIREGVKFHDGTPLTADDVAASWRAIIQPPEGVSSARESHYIMVAKVEAPDPTTVVASGASTESTTEYQFARALSTPCRGKMISCQLVATSAAVSGEPSWNFTSVRILKV